MVLVKSAHWFLRKVDLKISRKICRTRCQTLYLIPQNWHQVEFREINTKDEHSVFSSLYIGRCSKSKFASFPQFVNYVHIGIHLLPPKNISWNHLFSKNVTFTKFFSKWVRVNFCNFHVNWFHVKIAKRGRRSKDS